MSDARRDGDRWFEEDQQGTLRLRYRIRNRLYGATSDFQRVDVLESAGFGRLLVTDDIVMLSERTSASTTR